MCRLGSTSASSRTSRSQSKRPLAISRTVAARVSLIFAKSANDPSAWALASASVASRLASSVCSFEEFTRFEVITYAPTISSRPASTPSTM